MGFEAIKVRRLLVISAIYAETSLRQAHNFVFLFVEQGSQTRKQKVVLFNILGTEKTFLSPKISISGVLVTLHKQQVHTPEFAYLLDDGGSYVYVFLPTCLPPTLWCTKLPRYVVCATKPLTLQSISGTN